LANRQPEQQTGKPRIVASAQAASQDVIANPLDQLSSTDIAVNVARMAALPQATAVTNQADSENAQLAVAQTSSSLVSKPQVVSSAFKSNKDIQEYVAAQGDTVASVATKFGVTSESIMWSNDINDGTLIPGKKLFVPPVNGIVYFVKAGDTPESLAGKYRTTKDKVAAYNDAELTGLQVGSRIIIPDGQLPQPPTPARAAPRGGSGFAWGGASPVYGGNSYDFGWCTWYVAGRIAVPNNWGNANTWDNLAPQSGWTVSTAPTVGAVGQTDRGSMGHVAVIEAVSPDGSMIKYSDMNGLAGWGRRGDSDWVSASKFQHFISR
jgi:surface antigen/LysM repeat protein